MFHPIISNSSHVRYYGMSGWRYCVFRPSLVRHSSTTQTFLYSHGYTCRQARAHTHINKYETNAAGTILANTQEQKTSRDLKPPLPHFYKLSSLSHTPSCLWAPIPVMNDNRSRQIHLWGAISSVWRLTDSSMLTWNHSTCRQARAHTQTNQ